MHAWDGDATYESDANDPQYPYLPLIRYRFPHRYDIRIKVGTKFIETSRTYVT